MIRITCTHCRQVLTIDDGFAGGVCRCQHCGTIQTVPAAAGKAQDRGAVPTARTLYRAHPRKPDDHSHGPDDHHHGSGSGLDELAEIVSSSGLAGNSRRLHQPWSETLIPGPTLPPKKSPPLLAILGGAVFLVIVLIAFFMLRQRAKPPAPPLPPAPAANVAAPIAPAPVANFAGTPLQAQDTVIYLLDDGGSASDLLPAMQAACYQSIKSLGSDRRFKVVFWRDGSPAFPADGTARATSDEEAKCEAALHDAYAEGNTEVDAAMKSALDNHPDAIVLVTAKGVQLTDDFAETVRKLRGDSSVRIYTFGINGDSSTDPSKPGVLATIAAQTGGQFQTITSADLNRYSR